MIHHSSNVAQKRRLRYDNILLDHYVTLSYAVQERTADVLKVDGYYCQSVAAHCKHREGLQRDNIPAVQPLPD